MSANKKNIEPASIQSYQKPFTTQGEILKLDADCQYCKVYFEEEQSILNKQIEKLYRSTIGL